MPTLTEQPQAAAVGPQPAQASAIAPTILPTTPHTVEISRPPGQRSLIDGILPAREVSIISGASGVGKTTFLFQLVSAIQAGEDTFMGHKINHPIRVGYIAADRTWESYETLAARCRVDLTTLDHKSLVDDEKIDVTRLERDSMELLRQMMKSLDKPDLVIVDPMVIFLGVDPNSYQRVAPRLIQLSRMCRSMNLTILATHHATKARSDYSFLRPQDRISGSSALLGFSSSQMFIAGPEELKKPYSEFYCVNHNAPPVTIQLKRDGGGLFVPMNKAEAEGVNPAFISLVLAAAEKAGEHQATKEWLGTATKIDPGSLDLVIAHLCQAGVLKQMQAGEYRAVTTGAAH